MLVEIAQKPKSPQQFRIFRVFWTLYLSVNNNIGTILFAVFHFHNGSYNGHHHSHRYIWKVQTNFIISKCDPFTKMCGSVQKYFGRSKNILNQQKDWVLKSNNLQYNTLCCWVDRTNHSSTKHYFFHNFLQDKKLWKKIMHGTSNAWLMSRLPQWGVFRFIAK